jgi:hypothetical protein
MSRVPLIIRHRVVMLKRGLQKAGYLIGHESSEDRTLASFQTLAASVLADLMHLGVAEYKVSVEGEDANNPLKHLQIIAGIAAGDFTKEHDVK